MSTPSPEAQQIVARTDATEQLIADVRNEARERLRDGHLLAAERAPFHDAVGRAHHDQWVARLDPETADDAETVARIDAETVRLLRDAAATHADEAIKQRAIDALRRLRVPLEDPEVAAKAAAKARELQRERWAANVWRSFNYPGRAYVDDKPQTRQVAPTVSKAAEVAAELKATRGRLKAMAEDPNQSPDIRASARKALGDVR